MKRLYLFLLFVVFLPFVGNNPVPVRGRVIWQDGTPFRGVARLANFVPPREFWLDLAWSPSAVTNENGEFLMYAEVVNDGYVLLFSEGGDGDYAKWYIVWEDDQSFWKIYYPESPELDVGTITIYDTHTVSYNCNRNECSSTTTR
jgi:hypothetical protein